MNEITRRRGLLAGLAALLALPLRAVAKPAPMTAKYRGTQKVDGNDSILGLLGMFEKTFAFQLHDALEGATMRADGSCSVEALRGLMRSVRERTTMAFDFIGRFGFPITYGQNCFLSLPSDAFVLRRCVSWVDTIWYDRNTDMAQLLGIHVVVLLDPRPKLAEVVPSLDLADHFVIEDKGASLASFVTSKLGPLNTLVLGWSCPIGEDPDVEFKPIRDLTEAMGGVSMYDEVDFAVSR